VYLKTTELIKRLVDDGTVPGVSYAMVNLQRNDLTTNIYGREALIPNIEDLKENQLYDVASLTKVVGTTNVILQLLESNKLTLEDSISDYLPEWQYPQVTIRHLLTHTSGITGYIKNRNQLPKAQLIEALLKLHIGDDFNKKMTYSDINFIFLGWIAASILGRPIQTLVTNRVLRPLEMNSSTFNPTNVQECVPTENSPTRGLIRGTVHDPKAHILKMDCGSAGLFSTKTDLIKVATQMMNDDETLLKNSTKKLLMQNHAPGITQRSLGWALIKSHTNDHHNCIWHSGFTGTFMIIDRQEQQAMIFLSNRIHPNSPNEPFLDRRNEIIQSYLTEKEQ